MLGDFASLDVQNTYRGSDAYEIPDGNFYSARCADGKVPEGFGCSHHPGRFVYVAYIKKILKRNLAILK
ncbi:hypothetical protein AVI53_15720 [Piscirickettsia salmonis]|nr:hypothetical protein PSLF89_05165 [Piscirickettsia salmonis LF-89 = ATCC VR-1361]ALY02426.1 hypothetical protein AWE47_05800 [Piscirickettsia salmonis]AMA41942.1 hypothetical protein AWJ11_05795 [Piscirickettsia salmonis]AOS34419.1 hypothetical protein AVM72_03015 [Piscirickettsia salmonis]APS61834.1 hypothetical protein AVI53_15720 [Piscirickettsia salmonis]